MRVWINTNAGHSLYTWNNSVLLSRLNRFYVAFFNYGVIPVCKDTSRRRRMTFVTRRRPTVGSWSETHHFSTSNLDVYSTSITDVKWTSISDDSSTSITDVDSTSKSDHASTSITDVDPTSISDDTSTSRIYVYSTSYYDVVLMSKIPLPLCNFALHNEF